MHPSIVSANDSQYAAPKLYTQLKQIDFNNVVHVNCKNVSGVIRS